MKRNIHFLIIILLIAPFTYAICEDFDYQVTYLDKDTIGCYDGFQIIISHKSCKGLCFHEFSNITLETNIKQLIFIQNTSLIASPLIIVKETFNCTNKIHQIFIANLEGEESCKFEISFEEEYNLLQKKMNCSKKIDYEWNYNTDTCEEIKEEEEDVIESEKAKDDGDDDSGGSPGGSGMGGGGVPSLEDNNEEKYTPSSIIESNNSIQMLPSTYNPYLSDQASANNNQNTKQENNITDYMIYIIPILILIVMIQVVVLKLIKKKPKRIK